MKTFTPFDNSYQQCIDDNGNNHHLVDCEYFPRTKKVELIVLVQPFRMEITNILGDKCIYTFVIGLDESTGLRHLCSVSE